MYHQHFGVAEDAHFFFHSVHAFTLAALVATLSHSLGLDEGVEALFQLDVARDLDSFAGDTYRQVEEVVERVTLMVAGRALKSTAQLTLEQIGYYAVVTRFEVACPLFRLLIDGELFTVDFLVGLLRRHTIQLVVNAVEEETKELLRILLPVSKELWCHAGYLTFYLARHYRRSVGRASLPNQLTVGFGNPLRSQGLLPRELLDEELG